MKFNESLIYISDTDFQFIIKNGKRTSFCNGTEFESLCYNSYKFVKETAPELIRVGNFEKLIFECFNDRKFHIFETDIQYFDYNECLSFVLWIIDDLKYWSEMEIKHLNSEPDIDMMAAGINELNIFGDLNTLDMIAVKYGVLPWEVKEWSYQNVFDIQLKSVKEAKFQKEYTKRMQDKAKSKNKR